MDMSTRQETFVKTALEAASTVDARWLANQSQFNGFDHELLSATAKAAIIGSVAILAHTHELDDQIVVESLSIQTKGDARAVIDKVHDLVPGL